MSDEVTAPNDPDPTAPPPARSAAWYTRRWVQILAALTVGFVLGVAAGGSGSKAGSSVDSAAKRQAAIDAEVKRLDEARVAEEAAAEAQASALAEASAAAAAPPPLSAFKLTIKTLEKDCFGSAGCNVTYRVVPSFVGPGDPANLEVTYTVIGGEDGPVVATFTVDSAGTMSYDSENTISTPSARTVLRARVTSIERT